MEFDHTGKYCDIKGCGSFDFLPYYCTFCKKSLCETHRFYESHFCTSSQLSQTTSTHPHFTTCNICHQSLLIPSKSNSNAILQLHKQSGCPKRKRMNKKCSYINCQKREIVELHCKSCSNVFCLQHRLEIDHQCEKLEVTKPKESLKSLQKTDKAEKVNGKTSDKVAHKFSNNSLSPIGDESIQIEDRYPLCVFYSDAESEIHSKFMFFHRKFTVGKILDCLEDQNLLKNTHHVHERLNLFVVRQNSVHKLNHIDRLCNLDPTKLRKGDCVVIEYTLSLSPLLCQSILQSNQLHISSESN